MSSNDGQFELQPFCCIVPLLSQMSLCTPNSLHFGRSQESEIELVTYKEDVLTPRNEEDDPLSHWQVSSPKELSTPTSLQSQFDEPTKFKWLKTKRVLKSCTKACRSRNYSSISASPKTEFDLLNDYKWLKTNQSPKPCRRVSVINKLLKFAYKMDMKEEKAYEQFHMKTRYRGSCD